MTAENSHADRAAQLPLGFTLPRNPQDGQMALLPAPERSRPRLLPVPAQDAARPIVDLVVAGERL